MKKILAVISLISCISGSLSVYGQNAISAVFPNDGAKNINVGIIKWETHEGDRFDLYFGTNPNPPLYKADLLIMEEKPIIIELNKTYYWKIVEKKGSKILRTSKIFSFSTLPIQLNTSVDYTYIVDKRDYKVYCTTVVNGKEWLAQNLDYELPNNSWYYDNSEANKVYGRLYLGQSLTTNPNDICPEGWHIPTQQEWTELISAFGEVKTVGSALKDKTNLYWRNSNCARTNSSGMSILPAGSRDSKPSFANLGKYTFFWSSTPSPKILNSFIKTDFGFMRDNVNFEVGDPKWSYSIRCVKDK